MSFKCLDLIYDTLWLLLLCSCATLAVAGHCSADQEGQSLPDAAARENLELWSKLTVKRSLEDRIEKRVCVGESERGGQTERQGQISHFEFHALSVSIRHEQKHQFSVSQISRARR